MMNLINSVFSGNNISFNNGFFYSTFNNANIIHHTNNVNYVNNIHHVNNANNVNIANNVNNLNNANIANNVNNVNNVLNDNNAHNVNSSNSANNANNINNVNVGGNNENNIGNESEQSFLKKKEQYIRDLNEFQYKHLSKYSAINEELCAICILKFKGFDILKEFPCNHIFHKDCIFKWLKKSNICPLCKHDITDEVNNVNIISEDDDE